MRIVHVTYAWVPQYHSPEAWLKRIDFFTEILREMAAYAEIKSVHCINYEGVVTRDKVVYHFLRSSWIQTLFPFHIHRRIKKFSADTVIIQGFFPLAVILLRLTLGNRARIFVQHRAEKPFTGTKKILQRMADRSTTGYFFSSAALAEPWITGGLIRNKKKITEVFGVPSVFSPIDQKIARTKTKVTGNPVYLWVGDLDRNKNPLLLVTVFQQFSLLHPGASLYLLYRKTDLLEDVKKILSQPASQQIHLAGTVERDAMAWWFNSADFILSTSFSESSGAAVCEGMSCGCIPLLTRIPSFSKITEDGAVGLLFEAGNQKDLLSVLVASTRLDRAREREKTLAQYERVLSAKAIAGKILDTVTS